MNKHQFCRALALYHSVFCGLLIMTSIVLINSRVSASENDFTNSSMLNGVTLLSSETLDQDNLFHPLNMAAFKNGVRKMPEGDALKMYQYTSGNMNSHLVEEKNVFVAEYTYTYLDEALAEQSVSLFAKDTYKEGGRLVTESEQQEGNAKQVITLIGDEGDIVYWMLKQQKNQMPLILINGFDAQSTRSVLESVLK